MHLRPRDLGYQCVHYAHVEIEPKPDSRNSWLDSFGNHTEFFSIEHLHPRLSVVAHSVVERSSPSININASPTWQQLVGIIQTSRDPLTIEAREFLYDSRICKVNDMFRDFASDLVHWNASVIEVVRALNSRIFDRFDYSTDATQVTTSPEEALASKKGVCQDFAHVSICCLRSLGIPARYVSGYLLTHPVPGGEKLIGADASHAWFSVYAGELGWVDFDPTNNLIPDIEHVTVAWGRDYGDVSPVQGVFVGGNFAHLSVSVDVQIAE
jgi:transglutaminase-like putative cysteine protease